jgi:hypothetical protein
MTDQNTQAMDTNTADFEIKVTSDYSPYMNAGDVLHMKRGITAKRGDFVAIGDGIEKNDRCKLKAYTEGMDYFAVAVAKTTPMQTEDAVAKDTFKAPPNTANALRKLWESAADQLTPDELKWFSNLEEFAQVEIDNVSVALRETSSLLYNVDKDAAPDSEKLSDMLYSFSHQVDTIAKIFEIASSAEYRLNHFEEIEASRKARSEA